METAVSEIEAILAGPGSDADKVDGLTAFSYERRNVSPALAELYEKEGNYREALENYRKYHTAREYLVSFQSNTRLKSVQFINQIESARREAGLEKEKNTALNEAYKLISEKQKEILGSIHYAKRIQQSLLPNEKYVQRALNTLTGKCAR